MPTIGNAPSGQKSVLDGTEKIPLSGSQYALISAIATYIASGDTIALIAATQTLTNKRITRRPVTVTQSATPAINTDNGDIFNITGLAQAITSLTTNLSGTPTTDQMMLMQITDDGTGRAITPGASFAGTANNTLTGLTTVANKKLMLIWKYNGSAWELVGRDQSL